MPNFTPRFTTLAADSSVPWQDVTWQNAPGDTVRTITLPRRYFPATEVRGEYAPAGYFTDWQSDQARELVYLMRSTPAGCVNGVSLRRRWSHRDIADSLSFQHWLHSYRAQDCEARRIRRDLARGNAPHNGATDHRAYARGFNMRTNPGATSARPGSRPDTSVAPGRFGIEIEFNAGNGNYGNDVRRDAVTALQAQGVSIEHESYNHSTRPHWKMTTDATVSGGELVSPIMAGDTASLDEVRDCIRAIKAAGGTTARTVGMHVHHDITMMGRDDILRLIDTLSKVEKALPAYVLAERANGSTSCGAGTWTPSEVDRLRCLADYTPGSRPSIANYDTVSGVNRYRFFNLDAPLRKYGTVEFRGLGGTLHAGKVRVWVRMGQAVIQHVIAGHDIASDLTPSELVAELTTKGLLGRRTGEKFLSECERRAR